MPKVYVNPQDAGIIQNIVTGAIVAAKDLFPFGAGVVMILNPAIDGTTDAVGYHSFQYQGGKTATQVWAAGEIIYWDDTTKLLSNVVGGIIVGPCLAAALAGDAEGLCYVNAPDGV